MSRLCQIVQAGGPVTTTGAAVTTIVNFNPKAHLPDFVAVNINNVGFHVEGVLIAKDGSNNVASVGVARGFKLISGTLSALGTQATVIASAIGDAGLATIAATLAVSQGQIVLQATGIAATTIEWTGYLQIWSGEFA